MQEERITTLTVDSLSNFTQAVAQMIVDFDSRDEGSSEWAIERLEHHVNLLSEKSGVSLHHAGLTEHRIFENVADAVDRYRSQGTPSN